MTERLGVLLAVADHWRLTVGYLTLVAVAAMVSQLCQ